MHVCVLTPFLDIYKGGNHLSLLGACTGIQFEVLTSRVIPEAAELPSNVSANILPCRLGPFWYGIADVKFARAVLDAYPPSSSFWKQFDVLHLNQTLSPALLRLTETDTPLLYVVHHPVSVDREIALQESPVLERLRWRTRYAFPFRWQRAFCRRAPHLMTVSETVRQRLHVDYRCNVGNIHVVPNGVNGDVFRLIDGTDFDVCAVGSFLHPRKGFRYLLDVYRRLASSAEEIHGSTSSPETESPLRIADVGRRSAEQVAMLQEIPNLTIHGTVPHGKLVSIIQRSKVLVSTSLYEGFGLSLIEALACGRPAVAFDSGAVREVLASIDERMIVPQRDVTALVQRVREFHDVSRERREELRRKTLHLYSLEKSAQELQKVYARVECPPTGI